VLFEKKDHAVYYSTPMELNICKVVFDNEIFICCVKNLNILFQWQTTTGQKKCRQIKCKLKK
jgi:hypothetical protein